MYMAKKKFPKVSRFLSIILHHTGNYVLPCSQNALLFSSEKPVHYSHFCCSVSGSITKFGDDFFFFFTLPSSQLIGC